MTLAKTILVPDVFVTIDNSLANTALGGTFKTVIVGQRVAAGTATAETLVQVFNDADAKEKFGAGSMLAHMFSEWFKNNTTDEVYGIALYDAGGATESAGQVAFAGTITEAGTLYFYVNGKQYQVAVSSTDTPTDVATNLETLLNADVDLPFAVVRTGATLDFGALNKGTVCDQMTIKTNINSGEALPTGLTAVITDFTGGATDPDIADAIAALPDEVFNLIVNPYTDATNLTTLNTELTRRWGNTVQIDGHAVMGFSGTSSALVTKGGALNSEHFTMLDSGKSSPTPAYYVAAQEGGRVANSAGADPARPFRTLPLTGMIGDQPTDRRTFSEKNSILNAGLSTHNVQNDGTVAIDRLVTTYKTNALGAEDTSYQNTNTMFNLSFMRQSFKTRMLSLYPRHKLADDGTRFGAGQPIATPSSIKGDIIALYETWIELGLAENVDQFAETLVVERDAVNRSRVNVTMQPILVGQLYQFDTTLQFIV
jgi:phage tail sheath gpL-like